MHTQDLSHWTHQHEFDAGNRGVERRTRLVMWITASMMVIEIAGGWWFNSMALLADGWHMSSHAAALAVSAFAYAAARRYADDPRFAFGTWKIEVLGGFASSVFLLCMAALMAGASVERLLHPQPIEYLQAIVTAAAGLIVNLVCAAILGAAHGHGGDAHPHAHHGHDGHDHHEHHHDLNLRSAYVHVLADALTSVFAVIALGGGWLFGWAWLDPVMGIAGAVLVTSWAVGVMRATANVLLDREMDHPVVAEIRRAIEAGDAHAVTRVADLHVWRVGKRAFACAITVVTHDRTLTPERLRAALREHGEIVHSTIEVHWCG